MASSVVIGAVLMGLLSVFVVLTVWPELNQQLSTSSSSTIASVPSAPPPQQSQQLGEPDWFDLRHIRIMSLQTEADGEASKRSSKFDDLELEKELLRHVISLPFPVVVRGLPSIHTSDALQRWNVTYLLEQLPSVPNVHAARLMRRINDAQSKRPPHVRFNERHSEQVLEPSNRSVTIAKSKYKHQHVDAPFLFSFDRRQPMYKYLPTPDRVWSEPYYTHAQLSRERYRHCRNATSMTASLSELVNAASVPGEQHRAHRLVDDVLPLQVMLPAVRDGTRTVLDEQTIRKQLLENLHVSVTDEAVTTRLRYDESDSMVSQLHGYKRFVLLPPYAHEGLYIRPSLHPASRQSLLPFERLLDFQDQPPTAMNLGSRALEGFPLAAPVIREHATVAILEPGDMLWLPAFWFHHETTLEQSVSAAMFLGSVTKQQGQQVFEAVTSHELVQELLLSKEPMRETLMWHLISQVFLRATKQPLSKLMAIVDSRFSRLSSDALLQQDGGLLFVSEVYRSRSQREAVYCTEQPPVSVAQVIEDLMPAIQVTVAEALKLEAGVRESILTDVAELLASATAGVTNAHSFLLDCYRQVPSDVRQAKR